MSCSNQNCVNTEIKSLSSCSRCGVAKYCSKTCQVTNWNSHKQECKKLITSKEESPLVLLSKLLANMTKPQAEYINDWLLDLMTEQKEQEVNTEEETKKKERISSGEITNEDRRDINKKLMLDMNRILEPIEDQEIKCKQVISPEELDTLLKQIKYPDLLSNVIKFMSVTKMMNHRLMLLFKQMCSCLNDTELSIKNNWVHVLSLFYESEFADKITKMSLPKLDSY